MSTLERLFSYAKASEVESRENFTTEALAGAIRVEPAPFVEFLRIGHLLGPDDVSHLAVTTQVPMPGTGYLDLVISGLEGTRRFELWGELKVASGESGTQLDASGPHRWTSVRRKARPIRARDAPAPRRHGPSVLIWHALRRVLLTMNVGPSWMDLADYLSEIAVSDDFDQPVGARDAAAMSDFTLLYGKVGRTYQSV